MQIKIMGRNLVHTYRHVIMRVDLAEFTREVTRPCRIEPITLQNIDARRTNSSFDARQRALLRNQPSTTQGWLFWVEDQSEPVSSMFVLRRGGVDKFSKLREIDLYLAMMYTPHEYRGRGYCRDMMTLVLKELQVSGERYAYLAVLHDNAAALHLYESLGFERVAVKRFARVLRYNIPYHTL